MLYEPPHPKIFERDVMQKLEHLASVEDWDKFSEVFFRETLHVPSEVVEEMKQPASWTPILADARATLGDLRAISRYGFDENRFRGLEIPVLLQVGSESPRSLYVTDALAGVLRDVRIEELAGQAHEAMTTAPDLYVDSVFRFLDPYAPGGDA